MAFRVGTAGDPPHRGFVPTCPVHKGTRMEATILRLRFAGASVPVQGWRCPRGDKRLIGADELAEAQRYAKKLGLKKPAAPGKKRSSRV